MNQYYLYLIILKLINKYISNKICIFKIINTLIMNSFSFSGIMNMENCLL